jgi:hypothetical protein
MKTIEVTVSPAGETRVETKGFAGTACRDATKLLERALGVVASDTLTAEMYQQQPAQQRQEAKQ